MIDIFSKRRQAIAQYEGKDIDRDSLNDAREIESGLHNSRNQPLHRIGPTTPGSARVIRGKGVVFDYDNDIVDLRVRPSQKVGGIYRMDEPKKMKLSVNFGRNCDGSKYCMDLDVHPEQHRLNTEKIKPIKGIPKNSNNKEEIKNLASRTDNFNKKQKKKPAIEISSAKRLDFSHVGITSGLNKKKLHGVKI